MMKRSVFSVVLCLIVAGVFVLWGCGGGDGTVNLVPTASTSDSGGEPSTPEPSSSNSVVGTWVYQTLTMVFASDGSFSAVDPANGISVVSTYSTSGNQLIFTDSSGPSACTGPGEETGTYSYTIANEGTTLTLNKISDNCTGRVSCLDGHTFTLSQT